METYFMARHNPDWSEQEKDQIADSLFNALTPETVNELYTIITIVGPRSFRPIDLAVYHGDIRFAKRLLEELGAKITVQILDTLILLQYLWSNVPGLITPDDIKDLIAINPTDIQHILPYTLFKAEFAREVRQEFMKSLRAAVRDAAWRRRRHILHGV
jgi:hypothetical protein